MTLRAAVAAAALLLAAATARADSLLDKQAPEPVASKWVVGEAPPSFKALKGSCALLELLDPDDLVSQGLVSRTVEIAARAAERRLVMVSIACGAGADEGTAKAFASSSKVTWSFGIDKAGETLLSLGMPTLPRYLLVAPDGRVVWEGSPAGLDDRTLDGFLARARLWRPEEIAKTIRPAADAFAKGKHGLAAKKVAEALEECRKRKGAGLPVDGDPEKDGALVLDASKNLAEIRIALAAKLADQRWSLDAREMLEGIVATFVGTEWEAKAKAELAKIAADDRAQYEIGGMIRLREILSKLRPLTPKTVRGAIENIDGFLLTYENTQAGARARAEKARLEKMLK
jgi:hypothetical protein